MWSIARHITELFPRKVAQYFVILQAIQPGPEELLLSSRKVHPPVVRFGGKQDSLILLRVLGGGLIRIKTSPGGSYLDADKVGGSGSLNVKILGGPHKCMTPKLVGIQWFLVTQVNISN